MKTISVGDARKSGFVDDAGRQASALKPATAAPVDPLVSLSRQMETLLGQMRADQANVSTALVRGLEGVAAALSQLANQPPPPTPWHTIECMPQRDSNGQITKLTLRRQS